MTPHVQHVHKITEPKDDTEQETILPKRLDFKQLTFKYVQARLEHPQLLDLLEHAEWRPHPLQHKWLEHPFRERQVSRYVLKVAPEDQTQKQPPEKDLHKPSEQELPVNPADAIYQLNDLLMQGGFASLKHVIYLLPELDEVDQRKLLLKDLKLISALNNNVGQHARILYLKNADAVEPDFLAESQELIENQRTWKNQEETARHISLLDAWIVALIKLQPDDHLSALKPVGEYLSQTSLNDEIRGELFLRLATYLPPVMIPGLPEILQNSGTSQTKASRIMKNYAMLAMLYHALNHPQGVVATKNMPQLDQPYPPSVWQMEWDDDANLRRMYSYWLTLVKPDQGLEILQRQLMDHDPQVRDAVLLSFGYWSQQIAKDQLLKYAKNPAENIRLATVSGLAGHGTQALLNLAHDDAYRVRSQVAVELGYAPSLESALMLKELLQDQNSQVEQTAINQLVKWPDELAIPLCVHSVIYSSRGTRLLAAYQFQQRTGLVITQLDGTVTERKQVVYELAATAGIQTNFWAQLMSTHLQGTAPQDEARHSHELLQWLKQIKTEPAEQPSQIQVSNFQLTRNDIPTLENFLNNHPEPAYRYKIIQELTKSCPEFEAINQLTMQDVQQRRKAARSLAEYAQQASLSPLLLEEVARIIEKEQDEQVWRSIAQAISHDAGEIQIRIVRMMLKNKWVDLQKLGCDFAAEHHLGTLAPDIVLLFQSRDHSLVQKSAFTAGKLGNPGVIDHPQGGLRTLLNHPSVGVRKEASIALARLRDPQGIADLVRLAHSPDATVRYDAIELIGELNDTTLIKQLHQLLWLEQDRRVKMCLIKSLEQLSPLADWPYKQGQQISDQEQAKLWIECLNNR